MRKIFCNIGFIFLLCCAFFSCKKDETEDNQRTALEAYINSFIEDYKEKNDGKVLSMDEHDGVYVVLISVDSSAPSRELIRSNDVVEFDYLALPLDGTVFATSIDTIAYKNNLTPTPKEPQRVSALIAGLSRGLQRMALGDHGLILFPFTLGYNEEYVGQVRPESALIFEVIVTRVN